MVRAQGGGTSDHAVMTVMPLFNFLRDPLGSWPTSTASLPAIMVHESHSQRAGSGAGLRGRADVCAHILCRTHAAYTAGRQASPPSQRIVRALVSLFFYL